MTGFLLRRSGAALVVVLAVSMLVFLGVRAAPGDPATTLAGQEAGDPAVVSAIRHQYLLDRPLPEQYGRWLWLALHGNLGNVESGQSVADTIVQRLPVTLELAMLSMLIALLIGIPLGTLAAARRGKASDGVAATAVNVGQSVPHFWLALLFITWFAVDLHWLPATGYAPMHEPIANLRHMVLPCVVLGLGFAAVIARQLRSSMATALEADYARTARAKGLGEWGVIGHHALRNSLITVVTLVALDFGFLISGAIVTETIFSLPGLGQLSYTAIYSRDYPLIQGIVLVVAVGYVVVNLAADVAYSLLDPRVRISAEHL